MQPSAEQSKRNIFKPQPPQGMIPIEPLDMVLSRVAVLCWITCLLLPKLSEQARAVPQTLLYQSLLTPHLPSSTSFTFAGDKLHSRQLTKKAHFL